MAYRFRKRCNGVEGQGPPAWTTIVNSDREDDLLLADEDGRPSAIDENLGQNLSKGAQGWIYADYKQGIKS